MEKIKIISDIGDDVVEDKVNDFICNVHIIEIQHSCNYISSLGLSHTVMIRYKDKGDLK